MVMEKVDSANIKAMLKEHVQTSANLVTDESKPYPTAARDFASHQTVNHSIQEYARGEVHTNTVEGYFSLIKRGIIGTFHSVSKKHLPLYLAEFDHRYNHRKVSDGERTLEGLAKIEGKRLVYREPSMS
jgi:transposase-like protein